ncbi:MAG: bifunctional helix-turn-helix domain-containing protein/methylated-DNA--[protein]-cysteine S-methyltransferase [Cytophaga sp.]|uniref:bifunctional helix-turn-helix domain-containing protein/methylated-DNA--[protein]-cysteine S-methyltransferase n=1 Tax=Cytophaga sp. TaxID=29535 RepID=UPI003F7CD89C
MNEQEQVNYQRIAEAIEYIQANYKNQPGLDEIAGEVHVSPFHFQRLFTEWAGVSPKKFLQFISIEHAKEILKNTNVSLSEVAESAGLSGTGRLHDLFVTIEGMTPGEYKNGGKALSIHYDFSQTIFGEVLVASTAKGVCYMAFIESKEQSLTDLQQHFPNATFIQTNDVYQKQALAVFNQEKKDLNRIKLHLKGTDFQLKVWNALLKIPSGNLTTYGSIAAAIQKPSASRAVGTAIGSNPIAFLIPCHRVIQASGNFGGYMWGPTRKAAIIGWEAAKDSKQ